MVTIQDFLKLAVDGVVSFAEEYEKLIDKRLENAIRKEPLNLYFIVELNPSELPNDQRSNIISALRLRYQTHGWEVEYSYTEKAFSFRPSAIDAFMLALRSELLKTDNSESVVATPQRSVKV